MKLSDLRKMFRKDSAKEHVQIPQPVSVGERRARAGMIPSKLEEPYAIWAWSEVQEKTRTYFFEGTAPPFWYQKLSNATLYSSQNGMYADEPPSTIRLYGKTLYLRWKDEYCPYYVDEEDGTIMAKGMGLASIRKLLEIERKHGDSK